MKKELVDQTIHFAVPYLVLSLLHLAPHLLTYAFAGFVIGLIREITEEGNPVTLPKLRKALQSYSDLTFWILGGLAAGWTWV